jgi:hypothetical protein
MNRFVASVLAAGVLAAGPAAIARAASPAPSSPVPAGHTRVVDDTGTLAVAVPTEWTDIHTAPESRLGVEFPRIVANSADGLVGVELAAWLPVDDLESAVCEAWWLYGSECTPYDDGNLTGFRTAQEECCEGPGRWIELTANPIADVPVTVNLVLRYDEQVEAEAARFDTIAPTVEVLGSVLPDGWRLSPTELAPPTAPLAQGAWPYGEFGAVPQLGAEPVLGSGCGANGEIGDVIPDGLWAGTVRYVAEENRWDVNLQCVYSGAAADAVLAGGTATVVSGDRDYLVVDNNPRLRSVPNEADEVRGTFSDVRTADRCMVGISYPMPYDNSHVSTSQAWIRIHDGSVTWVVLGCDAGLVSPGG